jgi:hypothetical protein
MRHELE